MKQEISMPMAASIVAVVVLAIGILLWRQYIAPPVIPPEAAGVGTSFRGGSVAEKQQMIRGEMMRRQMQGLPTNQ